MSTDLETAQDREIETVTPFSLPEVSSCVYTSCFCEENVWCLCDHVRKNSAESLSDCYAVFLSNFNKTIPLWHQRASAMEDGAVIWDYHVVFVYKGKDKTDIYDLDSRLSFPCDSETYVRETIRRDAQLKPQYRRMFRVIPAEVFLGTFASDRSHMLSEMGIWLKPPPTYPCIATEASRNNIQECIAMETGTGEGTVINYSDFCQFLKPS